MMSLLLKRSLPPKSRRDAMFIEKYNPLSAVAHLWAIENRLRS